jgi:hypothetical protein
VANDVTAFILIALIGGAAGLVVLLIRGGDGGVSSTTLKQVVVATNATWRTFDAEWVEGDVRPAIYDEIAGAATILCPSSACSDAWLGNDPAKWIWAPGTTGSTPGAGNRSYYFVSDFEIPGEIVSAEFKYGFDDGIRAYIDDSGVTSGAHLVGPIQTLDVTSLLARDRTSHTIAVWGVNDPCDGEARGPAIGFCTYAEEPAGISVRLIVEYR